MPEQISVALCTYNGVRFITEQLDSILSQTVLPAQIVVSDDGSSDGTIECIEQFWAETIRNKPILNSIELKILRNANSLGVTKNFEQALKACTHSLIALCDQDDVWVATKLEQLSEMFAENKKLLLVFTDSRLVDAEGRPLGHSSFDALRVSPTERTSFEKQQGSQVFLKRNLATGATMMLRRQLLDVATPFPTEWVHDEWLALLHPLPVMFDFMTNVSSTTASMEVTK
jgi:glycosyltransferase involved in cell wall biosynthesis